MAESTGGDANPSSVVERRIKELIASDLNLPIAECDLASDRSLPDIGLDSGGIMTLVSLLEAEFGIVIDDDEFGPTHFSNVASIARLVVVKIS